MASREAFDKYPKDAYDWFSIPKAQFPNYAISINLDLFPITDLSEELSEDEIVISLQKLKKNQPLNEKEKKFWEELEKDAIYEYD